MQRLKPGVTETDAFAYVNEYQARYGLPTVDRGTWVQSIRPFVKAEGAAWQSGATWLYDAIFIQHLAEYIAKRRVLIQLGRWKMKAYSIEDMDNLVDRGVLDGEIDHPVFAAWPQWSGEDMEAVERVVSEFGFSE